MEPVSDLHEAALDLAEAGVPVFPCVEDGKAPACANGFHDATTDRDLIDKWWTKNPRFNVALSPHTVGLGVIDLDGPEGKKAWEDWQLGHVQLPPTYTVRTPRGGRHLYYRGTLPATQSKLGPHVDTRGIGSYVLVPPSVVGGKPYVLEDDRPEAELDPAVAEFLEALKRDAVKAAVADLDLPANVARAERLLRDYVGRSHVAVEGQMGNQRTFVTACEVMNLGCSPETALTLLSDIWNPACEPPWDDAELTTIVNNASRYAQNEPGAWAVESSDDTFGQAVDELPPDPRVERLRGRSLLEWKDKEPLKFWDRGKTLPKSEAGYVGVLYGRSSAGKTTLILTLIGEAIRG